MAANSETAWASATVANWYGQGERTVEVASATDVWYHAGMPTVSLRWVRIRDPKGAFATQALLCTDQTAASEMTLPHYSRTAVPVAVCSA